jgi:hypothetical protein
MKMKENLGGAVCCIILIFFSPTRLTIYLNVLNNWVNCLFGYYSCSSLFKFLCDTRSLYVYLDYSSHRIDKNVLY